MCSINLMQEKCEDSCTTGSRVQTGFKASEVRDINNTEECTNVCDYLMEHRQHHEKGGCSLITKM